MVALAYVFYLNKLTLYYFNENENTLRILYEPTRKVFYIYHYGHHHEMNLKALRELSLNTRP